MFRPAFLLVAIPQFFGAFGHAYLGERDIFPKLTVASTGLNPSALRVLRLTWHTLSLTFISISVTLMALGVKRGVLSNSETWMVFGISVWYAVTGIASIVYWNREKPQGWLFLINSVLLQFGLRWSA